MATTRTVSRDMEKDPGADVDAASEPGVPASTTAATRAHQNDVAADNGDDSTVIEEGKLKSQQVSS